jgi:CheY-like chemotaxis protein
MARAEPSFLYIDDDSLSRGVVKVLLERIMDFRQVAYFEDSHNFLEKLRALPEPPTVIFLGIQVKPYDGYEMLAALKKELDNQNSKIIAITAYVMREDIDKMKAAGFDGLISKPIIHRIFPELLNRILAGESVWYVS